MPASSVDRAEALAKVRPRNVCTLLAIVHDSHLRDRSFLAARYAESAIHFDDALAFLDELGWVRCDSGTIEPTSDVTARIIVAEEPERSLLFVEALLDSAGGYQRILARYLSQFARSNGELVYRADVETRLRDAAVRDFFMDLGAVTHRPDGDFFILEESFAPCVQWARNVLSPTPAQLAQQLEQRRALGLRAELAVVEWEQNRLGPDHQHRVRHVALESPAACFDIQSITLVNAVPVPRYIEVKAVGRGSLEFHWSHAEIEAAEILGERYFLYLLPVVGPDAFDLVQIDIIQDAYAKVYRNPSTWSTTVADIICRKRESFAS